MSLPNELHPLQLAASSGGYEIEQSLRWTGTTGDDYFLFTPSSTGNRRKFTFSVWVKRGDVSGSEKRLFSAASGTSGTPARTEFGFTTGNRIIDGYNPSGSTWYTSTSPSVFRDASAWYHIVLAVDTDQSTDTNRQKIWINGVFMSGRNSFNAVPQNSDLPFNTSGQPMRIGDYAAAAGGQNPFSGHMAELHYFDGTQITSPEAAGLGEFDDNGVWRPVEYTGGNYGTNGCYLKFDPSATNGIGHDHSGNGNNWTAGSGFSTSGTGTDVMSDTPTTNWCTLNPLTLSNGTLSEGNLRHQPSGNNASAWSTFAVNSGKWYWEVTKNGGDMALMLVQDPKFNGFQPDNITTGIGVRMYYSSGGTTTNRFIYNNSPTAFPSGFGDDTNGNIYSFMLDFDAGTFKVRRNNDSGTEASFTMPAALTAAPLHIGYSVTSTWPAGDFTYNFGQRDFEYTPPTGYKALNTSNLSAPSIKDGSQYFNTVLYTGTGSAQSISGVGFQPDLVWSKGRSTVTNQHLFDVVRGVYKELNSNDTNAEGTDVQLLTAFNADGFSLGTNGGVNNNGTTFASWNWLAGGTGSTNTAGSITSTVSANPSAGFSIVSYTGNNTSGATIGHGLGNSPSMIIVKERNGTSGWFVYHKSLGATKYLNLNSTSGATTETGSGSPWNDTSPSSTVFTVGANGATNENNMPIIAYCFAEVEGYSKFGSYTGNGDSGGDGTFLYLGFRPAFFLIKGPGGFDWYLFDNQRPGYNDKTYRLFPNLTSSENVDQVGCDLVSNGVKLRSGNANVASTVYYYAAFAENPFGGSGVSPVTAR